MKYEYWFANIKGITNRRKCEIRARIKNPEVLYYIEETGYKGLGISAIEEKVLISSKKDWKLEEAYARLEEKGVCFIPNYDLRFPKRLKETPTPPYAIYVKGNLPKEEKTTVAIIGARECSAYGRTMAYEFGKALAERGVQIVSGMARGVDSAGQRGALQGGGESFGILGCGPDICYPKEEIDLYMELQKKGGLISEYPPETPPLANHFPARNRIISGFSDFILVMEAKEKSGSLITVDMALEQGKDVYALPGPINSRLSQGCNRLIKEGAGILLTPQILLEELQISPLQIPQNSTPKKILLETDENIVYSCLDFRPQNLEQLMEQTKMDVSELLDTLIRLEMKGVVKEIAKNNYVIAEGNVDGTLSGNRGITCKSKDNQKVLGK